MLSLCLYGIAFIYGIYRKWEYFSLCVCQVLLQGLQNLNRAVHQDIVAVELFPKERWVAPSSVVLQDDQQDDEDTEEEEAEKKVTTALGEIRAGVFFFFFNTAKVNIQDICHSSYFIC